MAHTGLIGGIEAQQTVHIRRPQFMKRLHLRPCQGLVWKHTFAAWHGARGAARRTGGARAAAAERALALRLAQRRRGRGRGPVNVDKWDTAPMHACFIVCCGARVGPQQLGHRACRHACRVVAVHGGAD